MAKTAAQIWRTAHLPEQPGQALGASRCLGWQEGPEFFGEIHQDGAGFEDPYRRWAATIQQRRDLGVRVHRHKTTAELIAVADFDQPRVVLGTGMTKGQQFL